MRKRIVRRRLVASIAAILLFAGWNQFPGSLLAQNQTNQQAPTGIQQHAYFDPTAKWPKSSIYVCWENPDPGFQGDMTLVRAAVMESWEAASALRFTGWEKCAAQNQGIRIQIDDSGPRTMG